MVPGDITFFTTHYGEKKVAIVVEALPDGRYSIFCPKPTYVAVAASPKAGEVGTLFDPTLPSDVGQEPAALANEAGELISFPPGEFVPVPDTGFSNKLVRHENPVHPALFSGDAMAQDGTLSEEGVAFDGDGNHIQAPEKAE